LRKSAAFLICFFLLMFLGYFTLHQSFLLVGDWLGPILGSSIYTLFTAVFLLFGDPLKFVVLAVVWGLVAFIGGLIIRRRLGATLMMLLLFLSLIPILAASGLGMFLRLQESGVLNSGSNIFDTLPPIPSGFTLANVLEAPIIGKVIELVLGMMTSAQEGGGVDILGAVLIPVLIDFAMKPVIIVVAALVGVEVGRRLEKPFAPRSESLRLRLGGKPMPKPAAQVPASTMLKAALLVCLVLFQMPLHSLQPVGAAGDGFYAENLAGIVDDNGRAYVGDVFVDTSLPSGIGPGTQGTEGLVASLLVSQEGIMDLVSKSGLLPPDIDVSSFIDTVPPTFAVMVYAGAYKEEAGNRADAFSSVFSNTYGVSLQKLVAFDSIQSFNNGTVQLPISMVVYESPSSLEDVASGAYIEQFVGHGGYAELVDKAFKNGRLIPGATTDSADGSMIFTGFLNLAPFREYIPIGIIPEGFQAKLEPFLDGPVSVSGGVSYFDRGYTKEGELAMLDLLSLLGVGEAPTISPDADSSLLVVVAPNRTETDGQEVPNIKITTTLPLDEIEDNFTEGILSTLGDFEVDIPGEQLSDLRFQVGIRGVTLPLNVLLTKSVSPESSSPNGVIQVTVTVRNDDSKAMANVLIDDSRTLTGYSVSASIASGSTSTTFSSIAPGETRTLTYNVRLGEAGAYTLRSASLSYSYAGEVFEDTSNEPEAMVERPNPLIMSVGVVVNTWSLAADGLTLLLGEAGRMIMIGLTLIILAYVAFNWFRSIRRWLSGPPPPPASPS
jgi:hypothetical protein